MSIPTDSGDVKRAHTGDEPAWAEGNPSLFLTRLPAVVHATDILRLQTIDSQPADMRTIQATVVAELRRRRISQLQACHESGLVAAGAGVAIISKLINASNPDEIHVHLMLSQLIVCPSFDNTILLVGEQF